MQNTIVQGDATSVSTNGNHIMQNMVVEGDATCVAIGKGTTPEIMDAVNRYFLSSFGRKTRK